MNIVTHNSRLTSQSSPTTDNIQDKDNEKEKCVIAADNLINLNLNNDDAIITGKDDADSNSKSKETALQVELQDSPSPLVISISQSPYWLPSELHRRLSLGPVPCLHAADAGTASAVLFTQMLLEDVSQVRTPNSNSKTSTYTEGFQGFISLVVDLASLIES